MLEILLYAGRAIMPLLLTMALGCWLRRSAHWSDDFYRQLNSFCFHVLLPVQLFLNVYAIEDLSVLNWRLLGFIVLCIVGAAGLGVAVAPLFARERAQRVVIAQATFRANQVIMGIPLASALGGQDALIFASLVTSVCVPVFNMLAVLMLTAYSTDGKSISWREEVRQIFRNPLILGALAGLVPVLVRQLLPQIKMNSIPEILGRYPEGRLTYWIKTDYNGEPLYLYYYPPEFYVAYNGRWMHRLRGSEDAVQRLYEICSDACDKEWADTIY